MKLLVALIIIVGVVVLFNAAYGLTTFQGLTAKPMPILDTGLTGITQGAANAASAAAKAVAGAHFPPSAPAYQTPITGPR